LNLKSKFLIESNIFPSFFTTQIDQSGPADKKSIARRVKNFLDFSLKHNQSLEINFKLYMTTKFWSIFALQISMGMLNENGVDKTWSGSRIGSCIRSRGKKNKIQNSKFKILLSKLHWSDYFDRQNILFNPGEVFLYSFNL